MVTMKQVADHASVSIATVSFVVNGTKPVSDATRERVQRAMLDLGYTGHHAARALARGRTQVIALLFPALQRAMSGTAAAFFSRMAERSRQTGYTLVLWPTGDDDDLSRLAASGLADGILVMEVTMNDTRVEQLRKYRTPVVLVGRTADPAEAVWVDVDFEDAVRRGLDALAVLGHERVAFVGKTEPGSGATSAALVRGQSAYEDWARARGTDPVVFHCDATPEAGRALARSVARERPDLTAAVAINEYAAVGLLAGLRGEGIRVPTDFSVISVGSSPAMAAVADPVLTYLETPVAELASTSVDALIGLIESDDRAPERLVTCVLREGDSIAPAPPRS